MDKETLSNYGWIVIAVLVLSVMIALATPFGKYIEAGVLNTTDGLISTSQNALDVIGASNGGSGNTGGSDTSTPEEPTEPETPTPEQPTEPETPTTPDPALNPDDGTEPQDGDIYTHGDYQYTYSASDGGWAVRVKDNTKTEYGAILESINGQPVTSLNSTFWYCTSLKTAPAIPNSVTDMTATFRNCTKLTTAPVIPNR